MAHPTFLSIAIISSIGDIYGVVKVQIKPVTEMTPIPGLQMALHGLDTSGREITPHRRCFSDNLL